MLHMSEVPLYSETARSFSLCYCRLNGLSVTIGLLSTIESLMVIVDDASPTIFLSWTPPFTLDITDVDPDIAGYCVDVVSSTSSATLHSECGITVTEFTYPLPLRSWCDAYTFIVTPVNIVGNGISSSLNYSQELQCK